MIDSTLADYANHCAQSDLPHRPVLFAVHYARDLTRLGELGVPRVASNDYALGQTVIGLASPFAMSPVVAAVCVIVDRLQSLGADRTLWASRLVATDHGILSSHWEVPFGIDDRGNVIYGTRIESFYSSLPVHRALSTICHERVEAKISVEFNTAFSSAMTYLNMLATGQVPTREARHDH